MYTHEDVSAAREREIPAPVLDAYRAACGAWTGIDWTTDLPDLCGADPGALRAEADRVEAGEIDPRKASPRPPSPEDLNLDSPDGEDVDIERYRDEVVRLLREGAIYIEQVREDAADAESEAEQALEEIRRGDWDAALQAANRASGLEQEYGDDPVWRPFRQAIEQMSVRA